MKIESNPSQQNTAVKYFALVSVIDAQL